MESNHIVKGYLGKDIEDRPKIDIGKMGYGRV